MGGRAGRPSGRSFFYVAALIRAGRLEEAQYAFEKMLTYANHLGLYSEEIDPSGRQIGNFPQAFTHLALIHAALDLDAALNFGLGPVFQLPAGCVRPPSSTWRPDSCAGPGISSGSKGHEAFPHQPCRTRHQPSRPLMR